jgi:hypothetical protein
MAPLILDLGCRWSVRSTSRSGRFTSKASSPTTHSTGGSGERKSLVSLHRIEKRNKLMSKLLPKGNYLARADL